MAPVDVEEGSGALAVAPADVDEGSGALADGEAPAVDAKVEHREPMHDTDRPTRIAPIAAQGLAELGSVTGRSVPPRHWLFQAGAAREGECVGAGGVAVSCYSRLGTCSCRHPSSWPQPPPLASLDRLRFAEESRLQALR